MSGFVKNLKGCVVEAKLTWFEGRFQKGIQIAVGSDGLIEDIGPNVKSVQGTEVVLLKNEAILPGMINAHSHAFHRALRKMDDGKNKGGTFWSWRDHMYSLASSFTTETFYETCKATFQEMLASGITSVGEFHYLHHSKPRSHNDGVSSNLLYDFDKVILQAAKDAGIRIVLLLTYYEQAGLGSTNLEPAQTQFFTKSLSEFWQNFDKISTTILEKQTQTLGVAAHSVRAVKKENIAALQREADARKLPFHIHLEEQQREIDECVEFHKETPSQLILGCTKPNARFTAVHCTKTAPKSLENLIEIDANVCICPITEGNLADGIFPFPEQEKLAANLNFCLGSDCNIRICFAEEMRWFLFLQQMKTTQRGLHVAADKKFGIGERLFRAATESGARSLCLDRCGQLRKGNFMDAFMINLDHPSLQSSDASELLHSFIFGTATDTVVQSTIVGGNISYHRLSAPGIEESDVFGSPELLPHEVGIPDQPALSLNASEFAASLMKIPSVTGDEVSVVMFLQQRLIASGWHVYLQPIGDSTNTGRANIFATRSEFVPGSGKGPSLILNSHTDTVPPHIPPALDVGWNVLKGRGAADAKGQVATMVLAAEAFIKKFPAKANEVGLLFVVGEEVDHIGMKEANTLGLQPKFLICGEPTELKLMKRQKGILKARLVAKGVAGHSGYPDKGKSAVEILLNILNDIRNHSWPASPELGTTTVNIGMIKGGEAANVFAAHAEATVMFRLVTSVTSVFEMLKSIVSARVEVELISKNDPVDFDVLPGFEVDIAAFNTDVPYLNMPSSAKKFLYGAGSITDCHGPKEFVRISDMDLAVSGYGKIMETLLN